MRQTILLRYLRCDWSDLRLGTALDQSQSSKEKTCWHEFFKKSSWGISKYGRRQERLSAGRLETLEGVLFLQSAKKNPKRHLKKLHRKGASIFMQFNMISNDFFWVLKGENSQEWSSRLVAHRPWLAKIFSTFKCEVNLRRTMKNWRHFWRSSGLILSEISRQNDTGFRKNHVLHGVKTACLVGFEGALSPVFLAFVGLLFLILTST